MELDVEKGILGFKAQAYRVILVFKFTVLFLKIT